MTEEDLKIFFTGTYQLQQSISYHAEMLGDNDVIKLAYLHGGRVFKRCFKHIFNNFFTSHRYNNFQRFSMKNIEKPALSH